MTGSNTFSFITKMIPSQTVMWALFFFVLILFAVVSCILYFHWTQYRVTVRVPKIIISVYLLVSLLLLAFMASIALSYIVL